MPLLLIFTEKSINQDRMVRNPISLTSNNDTLMSMIMIMIMIGLIGITLNHDWGEPLTDSPEDIAAAVTISVNNTYNIYHSLIQEVRNEFAMGWLSILLYMHLFLRLTILKLFS